MATSVQTYIVNNIVSAIAAITADATYSRTVRTCTRNARTLADTPLYDAVWVERTAVAKTIPLNTSIVHCTLSVALGGIVQSYGDLGAAVEALEADIEKALAVDITRGGYALDTRVISAEETPMESQEPLAGLYMIVEVSYRHADGDPYMAR